MAKNTWQGGQSRFGAEQRDARDRLLRRVPDQPPLVQHRLAGSVGRISPAGSEVARRCFRTLMIATADLRRLRGQQDRRRREQQRRRYSNRLQIGCKQGGVATPLRWNVLLVGPVFFSNLGGTDAMACVGARSGRTGAPHLGRQSLLLVGRRSGMIAQAR